MEVRSNMKRMSTTDHAGVFDGYIVRGIPYQENCGKIWWLITISEGNNTSCGDYVAVIGSTTKQADLPNFVVSGNDFYVGFNFVFRANLGQSIEIAEVATNLDPGVKKVALTAISTWENKAARP